MVIKERDARIDLLKILSCMCVVALHTQRNIEKGILYNPILYYFSRLAIPIFFIVNGYLIFSKDNELKIDKNYKEYFKKKGLGIVKIVGIWAVINSVIFLITENKFYNPIVLGIKGIINRGELAYFWFFGALIILYTLMYYFYPIVSKYIKNILIVLIIISISIDILSTINILNGGYFLQSLIKQTFRIWTWSMYFIIGGYLKKKDLKYKINKITILSLTFTFIAIAYQYLLCVKYLKKMNSEYLYDNVIIILWCCLIFLLIKEIKVNKINKFIEFIGNQVIGVYLIHYIIINIFDLNNKCSNSLEAMMAWIGTLIISIVISAIINRTLGLNKILKY